MQDRLFPVRHLRRQPGLWVAAVLTLGLGLGASVAVFTLANAVLLRPLPYPNPDRLMTIGRGAGAQLGSASHRDVRFLREHVRSCVPIAATVGGSGLTRAMMFVPLAKVETSIARIAHSFFPVLFGVSAADPFTYLAVGIALIATVLLAALFPALRAARVDPLAAIRR